MGRRGRTWLVAGGLAATLAISSCGAGNDEMGGETRSETEQTTAEDLAVDSSEPAAPVEGGQPDDKAAAVEDPIVASAEQPAAVEAAALAARQVIVDVNMLIGTDDVAAAARQAARVATAAGGYVADEQYYAPQPIPVDPLPEAPHLEDSPDGVDGGEDVSGEDVGAVGIPRSEAWVSLRVPVGKVDAVVADLEKIGTILNRGRSTQDVTDQIVDLESRVQTQQASIERLQRLLGEAEDLGDIIALESELTRRQADLESMQRRSQELSGLADLATVTVGFTASDGVVTETDDDRGFLGGLAAGWDAFTASLTALATATGWLLPFATVAVLAALPVRSYLRRRSAAGVGTVPAADAT